MSKPLLTIALLSLLFVVLTTAFIIWFVVDYKRIKAGKKSILWERKEPKRKSK